MEQVEPDKQRGEDRCLLPSTCRDKTKPVDPRRNLRAGILFCPGIFISRAKQSIWGPPYFLVKNISIQEGNFGVSSEQERKNEEDAAHCASDGDTQSEQGERNGEGQKFSKVMPIDQHQRRMRSERTAPKRRWGMGKKTEQYQIPPCITNPSERRLNSNPMLPHLPPHNQKNPKKNRGEGNLTNDSDKIR